MFGKKKVRFRKKIKRPGSAFGVAIHVKTLAEEGKKIMFTKRGLQTNKGLRGGGAVPGLPLGLRVDPREQAELARDLLPVLRELSPQMRAFGRQIVRRLQEQMTARFLRFARDTLLGPAPASST